MNKILIFIIALLSVNSMAQLNEVEPQIFNENSSPFAQKTYAIVIGVADYPKLTQSKQLKWADSDALMVVDYLKEEDNVELYLYTNSDATNKDQLNKKIFEILKHKARSMDRVIIYFSGHGDISENDNNGFLLLNQVDKPSDYPYEFSDAIPIQDIKKSIMLSDVNKDNVFLIFDACKSGFAKSPAAGTNFEEHDKIVMMLSSKASEESNEDDELKHGIFSYFLIQGLKGLADLDDGNEITLYELKKYVSKNVKEKTNEAQNPIFAFEDDEFVISEYTEESHEEAEREAGEKINIASIGNAKGAKEIVDSENTRCNELYELLKKQAEAGVFFPDEVEQNDQKLATGSLTEKYSSEKTINSLVRSKKGSLYGVIEEGEINIFGDSEFRGGLKLSVQGGARSLAFSPNEKLFVTGSSSGVAQVWSGRTGDVIEKSIEVGSSITSITFLSNTEVALGTEKGKLILWNLSDNTTEKFKLHKGKVKELKVYDSKIYSVGSDGIISIFDLGSKMKLDWIKANASSFVLLTEHNRILSVGGNKLVQWDLQTMKEISSLEFKTELSSIEIDPFEQYAILGGKSKNLEIIDVFNFKPIKSKLRTKDPVTSLEFVNGQDELIVVDESGAISIAKFNVDMGLAAFNVRQLLNTCDDYKDIQYKIDGAMVLGLNQKVSPVIRALIKNDGEGVTLDEITEAKRYAESAFELGKDNVLDPERLEINMLLLDVYEVLKTNNRERYLEAVELVDRITELDPKASYAFNVAAELYLKLDDLAKAKEVLKKAEEQAPSWASPKLKTSEILVEENKLEEAKKKIDEVIKIDDEHAQAHADLAQVQLLTGDKEGAKRSIERAKELDKHVSFSDTVKRTFQDLVGKPVQRSTSEFSISYTNNKKQIETNKKENTQENVDLRDGLQVGDFYMGGTVFYIDETGKHGMVAAYQRKYNAMTWDEGMTLCLKMELNGFDDWRMPSLSDIRQFSLSPVYAPVSMFWTSTKNHMFDGNIFWFDTKQKIESYTLKDNKRFVLPIRDF